MVSATLSITSAVLAFQLAGALLLPAGSAGPESKATSAVLVWPPLGGGGRSLALIENRGQWPAQARFAGWLGRIVVRAEPGALGFELRSNEAGERGVLVRLVFEGSDPKATWEGLEAREALHSFFLGNDPSRWVQGARSFSRLRCAELYPGVDLELGAAGGRFEHELLVGAGVDTSEVRVRWEGLADLESVDGATPVLLAAVGSLLDLPAGNKGPLQHAQAPSSDPFRAARDATLPLSIVPGLQWATYLGSSGEEAVAAMDLDSAGDVYVGGAANKGDFPTTAGAFYLPSAGSSNLFVAKFDGGDGEVRFSALFGGTASHQFVIDLAVDGQGRPVFVGETTALDFPTTPGAWDPVKSPATTWSGFAARLSSDGTVLEYSTMIEGPQTGAAITGLALEDASGASVVVGAAKGQDFPVTPGAFQTTLNGLFDGFVLRLSPDGSALDWSTLLGGSGNADGPQRVALASNGDVIVGGLTGSKDFPTTPGAYKTSMTAGTFQNAFVTRMTGTGSALVWSTLLGGNAGNEFDQVFSLGLDSMERVYVFGITNSKSFPTTPGAFQTVFSPTATSQGFLSKLDAQGSALEFSTYLGTRFTPVARDMIVDPSGLATITGIAQVLFPTTPGAFDTSVNGAFDHVIARFSPRGDRLFYSTYFGGPSDDLGATIAQSPEGRIFLGGATAFPGGYPVTPGAFQEIYAGGQTDATLGVLELWLDGVQPVGASTPACLGPLVSNVTAMPQAGDAGFAFYCSSAPPSASGWLLVAGAVSPSAVQDGDLLLLDRASIQARFAALSSDAGYVEVPFSLANRVPGEVFAAQFVFGTTPSCPGTGERCSSQALEITVQ